MYTISGDRDRALPVYERSLALYEFLDDEWGIIHMRHRLATAALSHGDWSRCRALLEESLVRARALGSSYLEGEALSVLGVVADHDGDVEAAFELLRQSLAIARAVGFRWREAIDLGNLSELSLKAGRPKEAAAYARAGLELARAMDHRLTTVQSLARRSPSSLTPAVTRTRRADLGRDRGRGVPGAAGTVGAAPRRLRSDARQASRSAARARPK